MAVVDFEDHGRHGGAVEASAAGRAVPVGHVPTTLLVAARGLRVDQLVAYYKVPLLPERAAPMPHDLRGIVVVVAVAFGGPPAADLLDAALQRGMIVPPAQVHSAEQPDGRGCLAGAWRSVAVGGAAVGLDRVEESGGPLDDQWRRVDICHVSALQCHQLPADRQNAELQQRIADIRDGFQIAVQVDPRNAELQQKTAYFRDAVNKEGSFPASQTWLLVRQFLPSGGERELRDAYHQSSADVIAAGLGKYLLPMLKKLYDAHRALLYQAERTWNNNSAGSMVALNKRYLVHAQAIIDLGPAANANIKTAKDDGSLLDQLADILTNQGYQIVKCLWNRKHSVAYDTLKGISNCWRDGVVEDEETIRKALKRVAID